MTAQRQKYTPVMDRDLDLDALEGKGRQKSTVPPQRLAQSKRGGQETERMPGAHIPVVNPVSAGDRSTAMNSCRIYQKGKRNRTVS